MESRKCHDYVYWLKEVAFIVILAIIHETQEILK